MKTGGKRAAEYTSPLYSSPPQKKKPQTVRGFSQVAHIEKRCCLDLLFFFLNVATVYSLSYISKLHAQSKIYASIQFLFSFWCFYVETLIGGLQKKKKKSKDRDKEEAVKKASVLL